MRVRIGTRASALARVQTAWVVERLRELDPTLDVEIVLVRTLGDRYQRDVRPPNPALGDGWFTRALDEALLGGAIDLAVHSYKDAPTERPAGLRAVFVPPRASALDVWVSCGPGLREIEPGARVGTSSPRRRALLLALRPDLRVVPMRGNVDTRLARLDEGAVDALVLAEAGLERLGLASRIVERLDVRSFPTAPGQGALLVEGRESDRDLAEAVSALDDAQTRRLVSFERSVLRELGGGCSLPLGVTAEPDGSGGALFHAALARDGEGVRRASGRLADPESDGPLARRTARVLSGGGEP